MEVIQYGDQYGLFDKAGDLIEGGFASRHEAVEARDRLTSDAVEAVGDEDVEAVTGGRKRGKKVG
jgi:hypothetical protein